MTRIELRELTKVYGGDVLAVDDIDLTVEDGEFVTLVGPSGCGKTTTLRMIAGFETPTDGRVVMGDRDITDEPPYRRDVGMVFQSFALFPHMTVKENIAYGMRVADDDYSETEVDDRVDEMLDLIELPDIKDRKPDQLSGGQQQRVALARALALNPQALLLDEPLANLDEKLREQMQAELSRIQKELGVTTVFVTHNQEEAMTMSDRIVVMNDGTFEQVGGPDEVYDDPVSLFVADFIGKTNTFRGRVTARDGDRVTVASDDSTLEGRTDADLAVDTPVGVVVRPEAMRVERVADLDGGERADDVPNAAAGEVTLVQRLGGVVEYRIDIGSKEVLATRQATQEASASRPTRGDEVRVSFAPSACRVLTEESLADGVAVGEREPAEV